MVTGEGESPLICLLAAFNENWKCYVLVNEVSVDLFLQEDATPKRHFKPMHIEEW